MSEEKYRIESDLIGEIKVPLNAYWGAHTQRAVENFTISGLRFPRNFLHALGMIKMASAITNMELGLLDKEIGEIISRSAEEVMNGRFDDQFVVDIFQTGSGTSTNMNANEVIANRANEILGGRIGDKKPVHPNDHVNMGQSSNDVIPSCIHISALESIENELLPELRNLHTVLEKKANEFDEVVKVGRTHLQDAVPVRLGQEFSGYASMIKHGIQRIESIREHLSELAIGGTAVGTGVNTHPKFAGLVIKKINKLTNLNFREAENHFEAQGAKDAIVEASSALKTVAVSLTKIANDVRLLASGPRCGIGEIILPEVQAGSSIMPGKVNPVIVEVLCQVSAQVIGNDLTITIGGLSGNLELNVMMPVMAYNLLQSINILSTAVSLFTGKCISGILANEERCRELVEKSIAVVTAISPYIGYDSATALAREAYESGKTILEIAIEKNILPEKELKKIFDIYGMTNPK